MSDWLDVKQAADLTLSPRVRHFLHGCVKDPSSSVGRTSPHRKRTGHAGVDNTSMPTTYTLNRPATRLRPLMPGRA